MSEQGVLPLRRISEHQGTVIRLFGRKRIERELRVRSSLDRADMTDLLNLRKKNGVIILAILPQCQPDSPSGWGLRGGLPREWFNRAFQAEYFVYGAKNLGMRWVKD